MGETRGHILSRRSQSEKNKYRVIPPLFQVRRLVSFTRTESKGGCRGLGRGRMLGSCLMGTVRGDGKATAMVGVTVAGHCERVQSR